jgi:hypothetical protein
MTLDEFPQETDVLDRPYPWRAEFTVADGSTGDRWYTNAMRYPDRDKALEAALSKATAWTLVTRWRAVDDSVPLLQPYEPGSEDGKW